MNITGTLQAIGGNGGTVLPQPGNGNCFDWSSGGAGGGGGRIGFSEIHANHLI